MAAKTPLPVDEVLPEVIAALRHHPAVVLQAPTGAGKTTRVPPALLQAGLADPRAILMLEPRRIAARAAARRMALEAASPLGEQFGYHVRFDRLAGPRTRVLTVTPGILLRYLHDDPFLERFGILIFDEFHERGLDSDLALGMARLLQHTVRPDLRIVVMSATLETGPIADSLGQCPVVSSSGRLFNVEIRYEPRDGARPLQTDIVRAIDRLARQTPGDILVFLPGMVEIRQTGRELEALAARHDWMVLPLHGDLPPEQQDAALLPQERRKIVLATNVAETSVTVEGVTGVVDSGLARSLILDPAIGLDRLELIPIARCAADQRAGRAGRTQPGICVRLWSEASHRGRAEKTEPEIRRIDLAGAVLQLLTLNEMDIEHFPWLDAPPAASLRQARLLLRRLGACDEAGATDLGRLMARLPVHPRLARLLIAGHDLGGPARAALAAALLAERSPFPRGTDGPRGRPARTASDILDAVERMEAFEAGQNVPELHRGAGRFILRARDQLLRGLRQELPHAIDEPAETDESLLRALLAAFPDRVVRRRNPGGSRGVMVGGRGVKLSPRSGVTDAELFLAIDVDAGDLDALVRQASSIERAWLPHENLSTRLEVGFDPAAERIVARTRTLYEDLVLEEKPTAVPAECDVPAVLRDAALAAWDRLRPDPESPAGRFLVRLRCLREWVPELDWPAWTDEELREAWLAWNPQARSFADLRAIDWLPVILQRLSHAQRQAVDLDAPERIAVPSGSELPIAYALGKPPVLAVRIQELFGLAETPRVARGRVKLLLHLLAPNFRPQQVTDDLASFWANTYPRVRKDLRGRYPKHAWPEDPLSAEPLRGAKRRASS